MSQLLIDIPDNYLSALREFLRTLPGTQIRQVQPTSTSDESRPNTAAGAWGRGAWKGKVWMADDFDAPLEDFKEYLP